MAGPAACRLNRKGSARRSRGRRRRSESLTRITRSKSGRVLPHSKTLSRLIERSDIRQVLECGSPLPLLNFPPSREDEQSVEPVHLSDERLYIGLKPRC